MHNQNFNNLNNGIVQIGGGILNGGAPLGGFGGFSFDDGGMDEYDVADER